ncbi:maleylpyruvate isomerase family mycothiol-dependent enzyme [Actinokineospora bangkokensis]|uniref:Mycothiol-dependent maleylpyruvate isomerase metal-binding domain-containing protein n=1 Tax=Actinokineospora bangkokensis TaxID=1193682 RepID=A0A1Q9LRC6_9PSEU|nr:maleylpyruvate isomerase family mycothiol-dependent enzyme [Actinokineospora bangkokensis]OLR94596.1 hypothetical protein BJP25_12740 [Actinokineospora bangkokensis]
MDFPTHAAQVLAQTEVLARELHGAELRTPVPSCPGWTLGMLVRHIGAGHRWAAEVVRTGAALDDTELRVLHGDDSGVLPGDWLVEGAAALAEALLEVGPGVDMWAPFDLDGSTFWARRFANETLVHRADATLAVGLPFTAAPGVLAESLDEWMDLDVQPEHFTITPRKRDLLGPGRAVALEAPGARWFVDLTGEVITWDRGDRRAAVTARGSLADLLLLVYRRVPASAVEVEGDAALLDFWLDHVAFG